MTTKIYVWNCKIDHTILMVLTAQGSNQLTISKDTQMKRDNCVVSTWTLQ